MPGKIAQSSEGADAQSTNAVPADDRHDAFGAGISERDKLSKPMDLNRPRTSTKSTQQTRPPGLPADSSSGHSQGGSHSHPKDNHLQINLDAAPPRRPIETSIWDWDTPLDSIGESSSYYYEPQGELLQEHKESRIPNSEFSIPQAVGSSGTNWQTSNGDNTPTSNGFAVPKLPTAVPRPTAGVKRKSVSEQDSTTGVEQPDPKRPTRTMSDDGNDEPISPMDARPAAHGTRSQSAAAGRPRAGTDQMDSRTRMSTDAQSSRAESSATPRLQRVNTEPATPMVLPARKVFPIQIGDKLFRLSGASISSDAPSYFSQFFEEQLRQTEGADSVRTLYIDRDPATFEDISLHLQGYHIEPRDGPHFVKLFADAQFFSLPRLTAQLFASPIYIRIGDAEFQIPRDLFSNPGDSPNYFSLGFSIFFTTPTEVFPGLSQRTLLRPPSILPPSVPNRSAKTFADILHFLKGYPVEIRSEDHRAELLRDARYFHLKGLEQRLIPHTISYNLARKTSEIILRLEDIRQSGVSFVADSAASTPAAASPGGSRASTPTGPGWVFYQRPYVDSEAFSLVVEMSGDEGTLLSITPGSASSPARFGRATFFKQTLSRVTSLFSVIANKMNLPVTQPLGLLMMERGAGVASLPVSPGNSGLSEERVKVRIGHDADVIVDGKRWLVGEEVDDESEQSSMSIEPSGLSRPSFEQRRTGDEEDDEGEEWVLRKAQWRLRLQPMQGGVQAGRTGMEIILSAVKIEAYSTERSRNVARGFLT